MPVLQNGVDGAHAHATHNGCPFTGAGSAPRRAQRLTYHLKGTHLTDTLHLKATDLNPCTSGKCMGSTVRQRQYFPPQYKRPNEEILEQAKEFIDDYYASMKKANSTEHDRRWRDIQAQVEEKGVYDLTYDELLYGAKMAWRNAPRCIGRYQWNNLQVLDQRHVKTAQEMFDAVCEHVRYATKDGQMKTAISIFPVRTDGKHDYKFWNNFLFRYAGYTQPDGSVIGDPDMVEFTEVCQSLGWRGKGTPYDYLPAIVSANGEDPVFFDWPEDVPLELVLRHPKYDWFEELNIKVNCIPMQGDLLFDCGGMHFPACPITGWFMSTEPVRDLLDENRYNFTEMIAKKLGYDTSRYNSLWKDAAFLEVHLAVLHSFQLEGVMTQDPHTLTESFMKHMEKEHRLRGGCPSDWVWITPPSCSSLTPVFHQEMLNYHLRPALEYQEAGWKIHEWKTLPTAPILAQYVRTKERCSFKAAALAVLFAAGSMRKALDKRVKTTILFASQTGKAETFSHSVCDLYKHAFDAKVVCMDEYDISRMSKEQLVVVVTSTFGNGDPPDNGETFARALMQMKNKSGQGEAPLKSVRFAVFALGSRAYPHFCGFGHSVDTLFEQLGAQRVHTVGEGDELCGQEESFRAWAESAFKFSCLSFDVGHDVDMNEATANLLGSDLSWAPDKFRLGQAKGTRDTDLLEGLSTLHRKKVVSCTFISRTQLQAPDSSRQTILVRLDTKGNEELKFTPGDHLGVFPANEDHLVQAILDRVEGGTDPDEVLEVEALHKKLTAAVVTKTWMPFERLPPCSLRTALSRYLDITTPPTPQLLGSLSMHAAAPEEMAELEELGKGGKKYESWKFERAPTLTEVLQTYPSLKVPPALLLSQLPVLQQRYYSISSSPQMYPGEIHATLAVVSFRTQGGKGPVHNGVCSSWFNRIGDGETVPCFVRPAKNFHLPDDPAMPVLMVGPGTGIAPLRGFWQQRQMDISSGKIPEGTHGDMTLVFGCRQSKMDHIYQEETAHAKKDGALTDIYTAYSREPGTPKTYVQHVLHNKLSKRVQELLENNGHIYVCGDVAMADDVCTTVQKILEENSGMKANDSEAFIRNLKDSNRYHEDIFGVTLNTTEVREAARNVENGESLDNGHINGNDQ